MKKLVFFSIFFLLLNGCKKEVVVFASTPNEEFELPMILKFNGNDCFYDDEQQSLTYSASEELLNDFSVFVEFMHYSTVSFEGKELKNNAQNHLGKLEYNTTYQVEIKSKGTVRSLALRFTSLPIVRVVTFDQLTNEPKSVAKMTIQFPEVTKERSVDWIGIEVRGYSSQFYPKKSYGLGVYSDKNTESPIKRSFFDFGQAHNWILDAMYADKSRARNKTSFELWRSMGDEKDHPGVSAKYVEVFLNNTFLGIYAFTENFGVETLNLSSKSVLYRGMDNSKNTYFEELPPGKPTAARWGDWEQRFPKPSEQIRWQDFHQLAELVVSGTDEDFLSQIGQQVDMDNVIDYYLFVNLLSGLDNIGKNWCFLKRTPNDQFLMVPWDLDATWGRLPNGNSIAANKELINGLFRRLIELNPDNFDQRMRLRWKQLRTHTFSETNLQTLFTANRAILSKSGIIDMENALWQQSLDLEQEAAFIHNWISERLIFLDGKFN